MAPCLRSRQQRRETSVRAVVGTGSRRKNLQRTCHAREHLACAARRELTCSLRATRAAMRCCNRSHHATRCLLRRQPGLAASRGVVFEVPPRAAVRSTGMSTPRARSNADAGLLRELDSAAGDGSFVQAWVRLKPDAATESVVQRVAQRVGHPADSLKLLPNLGALVVRGSPAFVRELIHQPEIQSAHSTSQPLGLIPPVESREVRLPRARRPPSRRKRRPRG